MCLLVTFGAVDKQELQRLWLQQQQSSLTSKPFLSSVSVGSVGKMKPMCLLTTADALDWEHKAKESCPCCFINIADKSSWTNYGIHCVLHSQIM